MNDQPEPTIGGFLVKLGEAWELFDAFANDPRETMTKYGLTPEQQDAVLTGELSILQEELAKEFPGATVQRGIIVKGIKKGIVR
jgi:hypothetical protein